MKIAIYIFMLLGILALLSTAIFAQPGLPGSPEQAPIDGGLSLLAAAGGVYAYKKLRHKED